MKIVINKCYGGFSLSEAAYKELGLEWDGYGYGHSDDRASPDLVAVVEKLGEAASGNFGELKVVDIPDGIDYRIEDYDGIEWIAEGRTWG